MPTPKLPTISTVFSAAAIQPDVDDLQAERHLSVPDVEAEIRSQQDAAPAKHHDIDAHPQNWATNDQREKD